MKNNAKFIFRAEVDKIIDQAGKPWLTNKVMLEILQDKYPWVEAFVWVTAGMILFGSEECLLGWYRCQD